jgi:hypothetical protein
MLSILKALVSLFIALLAFSPTLLVWGFMHWMDRRERLLEQKRKHDAASYISDLFIDKILRRHKNDQ